MEEEFLENNCTIFKSLNTLINSQKIFMKHEAQNANLLQHIFDEKNNKNSKRNSLEKHLVDQFKKNSDLLNIDKSQDIKEKKFINKKTKSMAICSSTIPYSPHATISGRISFAVAMKKSNQKKNGSSSFTAADSLSKASQMKKRSSIYNIFSYSKNQSSSKSCLPFGIDNQVPSDSFLLEKNEAVLPNRLDETSELFNHPIPEYIFDWYRHNLKNTESCEIQSSERPHSIAFFTNNFNKNETSKKFSQQASSTLNLDLNKTDDENQEKNRLLKQASTLKSKEFSIPLNASFFHSPAALNFSESFSLNSKHKKNRFKSDVSSGLHKASDRIRSFNTGSLLLLNNGTDENNFTETNKNQDLDETLLFKPGNSFNTDEGSCLKELDAKLKIADEKSRNNSNLSMESKWLTKQENVNQDRISCGEDYLSNQKRNSCMVIMSESSKFFEPASNISTNNLNTALTFPENKIQNDSLPSSVRLRDSVISLEDFSNQPSPVDRGSRASNKNFRKMSQLNFNNIFNNHTNSSRNKDQLFAMDKILNEFLVELPKLPDELCISYYDPSILEVEPDWNKFVSQTFAQSLQKNHAKQQMALWELIVTESSHIKTTKIIIDVFLSCLARLKTHETTSDLFKEIEINQLFSNIVDVFNCNLKFWKIFLYPIIQNLNKNNTTLIDTECLIEAFTNFQKIFAPYEQFILEKADSLENFKKHSEENEFFAKFITWAENYPSVGRLKITDFMMIPVQRLTKYELLLKKIYQFTDDETKRDQILHMIECVYTLPNSINIKLKHLAQLNSISESIEKYEGIIGPNDEINDILSLYRVLDIKSPLPGCLPSANRELIHQGPLKLKDTPKSFDVYCFLFTDLLLITQLKKTKKYRIIRPPVLTNRIIVRELTQTDKAFAVVSLNDYKLPESVCMFISNQSKKWIELLEYARNKYLDEIKKAKAHQEQQITLIQDKSETFSVATVSNELESQCSRAESLCNEDTKLEKESGGNERRDSVVTIKISNNEECGLKSNSFHKAETQNESQRFLIDDRKQADISCDVSSSNSFKSYKSGNSGISRQYQQQHTARINSRIFDRRIQRRNMTDPLSTSNQINNTIDEKHSVLMNSIIKRNSFNDKNHRHQTLLITPSSFADSTSTILSTDSGVSSSSCENRTNNSKESMSKLSMNQKSSFVEQSDRHEEDVFQEKFEMIQQELCLDDDKKSLQDLNEVIGCKTCSLKQTNSALSTGSSTFSTSSSSYDTNNVSYSNSINSSSTNLLNLTSQSNSMIINSKRKLDSKNASSETDSEDRKNCEENAYTNLKDSNITLEDDDYDAYFRIDVENLNEIQSQGDHQSSQIGYTNHLDEPKSHLTDINDSDQINFPKSRHLFSTTKNISPLSNHLSRNKNLIVANKYDSNNNQVKIQDVVNLKNISYSDLIKKTGGVNNKKTSPISQFSYQQPNFLISNGLAIKKPLIKIHSKSINNESVRINSDDLVIKNCDMQVDNSTRFFQKNSIDDQSMNLAKLLNTTTDATEV